MGNNTQNIAETATLIVRGYAFIMKDNGFIGILNLNHPNSAMVVTRKGDMIETNMSPIEQEVVLDLCQRNLQFMEE